MLARIGFDCFMIILTLCKDEKMLDAQKILDSRKKELERKRTENALFNRQIEVCEQHIFQIVESLGISKDALAFLTNLADGRRGAMKGRIESVSSEAMKLIYGPSYRVELSYSFKNNRSNLDIEMVRSVPQGDIRRDIDGFGGGVADTISVPMRLMVLVGSKTDKVCILDECWKHIDENRLDAVGKFLRSLVDMLGMQVIFSTHHKPLQQYADVVYNVTEDNGKAKVSVS